MANRKKSKYEVKMDLEHNIDDLDTGNAYEEIAVDEYDLETDEWLRQEPSMELLNNQDYSLNSPLILDEIIGFRVYMKYKTVNERWGEEKWKRRASTFTKFISVDDLSCPENIHADLLRYIKSTPLDFAFFDEIMSQTRDAAQYTSVIPDMFIKSWLHKLPPKFEDIGRIDERTRFWGAWFVEFHMLTLILNSNTEDELKNLGRILKIAPVMSDLKQTVGVRVISSSLGPCLISEGFIVVQNAYIMMDRNYLLMFKDMCAARFQTLSAMQNRYDKKFNLRDKDIISKLYDIGDDIIMESGNNGFNCLKMLEPMCNLQLCELVAECRPLIPRFTSFKNHVRTTVNELRSINYKIKKLELLIQQQTDYEIILTIYGSFRHWGHPYLDYLQGLEKLYQQVTLEKHIDVQYANTLASDLAFIVLHNQFKTKRKWFVDKSLINIDHPLHNEIMNNIWPTPKAIEDFGCNWHTLPLTKCFDIPDVIDPSILYSDKSHSMTRSEIVKHIRSNPGTRIPTRRVLKTLLTKPSRNWPEFLQELNDHGINLDSLVIGLKGKEREIKVDGRYFSLMSWDLRDYFVITEYLIKTHYVPLFKGLTMADDLNMLIRKMLDNSAGQTNSDYEQITIANHIDYQKWNNHQRKESTYPVFKVMGQFLGYPELIARTHEFFEKSWIYYCERADLMMVVDGELKNKTSTRVCWNGQAGGLEGLRQKGWSILNLLVIRREGCSRNTNIKTLAQGDNQVICTTYQMQKYRQVVELTQNLNNIVVNNEVILSRIVEGTRRLGLIINEDETMQSANFLNYGKNVLLNGNLYCLETKRWSRVTCTNNDQIPTLAGILSTVSSNALTVSHYSSSPIDPMYRYNFLGNFVITLINIHNPALRGDPKIFIKGYPADSQNMNLMRILLLYLDPCIGGVSGMSLTRFLIRNFPDPVTECLTFLKAIHDTCHISDIRRIMSVSGNPETASVTSQAITKLIENPTALNIKKGLSVATVLRHEIKKKLFEDINEIKNIPIRDSVKFVQHEENQLERFLFSINPLFPRFISQFKESTYVGLTDSLISLFQNSRTIRSYFQRRLHKEFDKLIIKGEVLSYINIIKLILIRHKPTIWTCSSTHADKLREKSWRRKVVGATIPHPFEMTNKVLLVEPNCKLCELPWPENLYVSIFVPKGLAAYKERRGPHSAYLGSKTSESTSLIHPWEKETKIPLIRRAAKLRDAIGWFVEPYSKVGLAILDNLKSLTGEDWSNSCEGYKRTGSALHRFSSTRQDTGGYSAQSPVKLTWMVTTSNTLNDMMGKNYDFMFQAVMIYSQITVGELHDGNSCSGIYHGHISCKECLREIDEPTLTTALTYIPKDVSHILDRWKPKDSSWGVSVPQVTIPEGHWDQLSDPIKSFHIGSTEGFLFGDGLFSRSGQVINTSLFPISVGHCVWPKQYMEGILYGIIRSVSLSVVYRRSVAELTSPDTTLIGGTLFAIKRVARHTNFMNIMRENAFMYELLSKPHKIPPSYPMKQDDLSEMGEAYLHDLYMTYGSKLPSLRDADARVVWIFSDVNHITGIGLAAISHILTGYLSKSYIKSSQINIIRGLKSIVTSLRSSPEDIQVSVLRGFLSHVKSTPHEVRHAARTITKFPIVERIDQSKIPFGHEVILDAYIFPVEFQDHPGVKIPLNVPYKNDPMISGLRLFQCATGSHYKIRAILSKLKIRWNNALVGGDGSGGICACLLRMNPQSQIIFNSLLDLDKTDLKGSNPAPPSAIVAMGNLSWNCINLNTVWKHPSDLTKTATWDYFRRIKRDQRVSIDLIILDMESKSNNDVNCIIMNLLRFIFDGTSHNISVVVKSYIHEIYNEKVNVISILGPYFTRVNLAYTDGTPTSSSEVYVHFNGLQDKRLKEDHPNYQKMRQQLLNFPVFRSEVEEFQRGLKLYLTDTLLGVPDKFLINYRVEFVNYLTSIGVRSGTAAGLIDLIHVHKNSDDCGIFVGALIVIMNELCPITRGFTERPLPPSDTIVRHMGAVLIGFGKWLALKTNEQILNSNVQVYLDMYYPFSWERMMTNQGIYFQRWSLFQQYRVKKNIYLDDNTAEIAHIIRLLTGLVTKSCIKRATVDTAEAIMENFDKGLTIELVNESSSILSALYEKNNIKRGIPCISVELNVNSEDTSAAYTD
uniref:Replicase n=1 Tax=Zeugodacus cucurbitae sigmavirus-B2 TaxID=3159479 RepID=A0AAU7L118_9RHAB